MAQAHLFDARSGNKSSLDLEGPRFGTEPNEHVIHRAVVAELDNRRRYTAHTKGRSDVRGSGAKLYRQKGTGRARAGDAQSPTRYGGAPPGRPHPQPAASGPERPRQKGAGRARAGDAQSPTRYGGGTWGGPKTKPARFGKRINRKEARAAFDGGPSPQGGRGRG